MGDGNSMLPCEEDERRSCCELENIALVPIRGRLLVFDIPLLESLSSETNIDRIKIKVITIIITKTNLYS